MSTDLKKIISTIAFCSLVIFFGCSSENNHAGVLTETESGKTIAGIVSDVDGNPLSNVEINLLQRNHVAARMSPIQKTFSHENGIFKLDSIEMGDFAIQMSDVNHSISAYTILSINENTPNSNIDLAITTLNENASLEINLSEFTLTEGDTLCITGTINCAIVDSFALQKEKLILNKIPATKYTNASLLKGNKTIEDQDVAWSFKAGRTLYVGNIDSTKIAGKYSITIPNAALDSLKHVSAPHSLDSVIVRFKLSSKYKNPSLADEMGAIIKLMPIESKEDSISYLAILPRLDTTTFDFSILENDTIVAIPTIITAKTLSDTNDVIGENVFWGGLQLHNHSLGINFIIETDGEIIKDSNSILLSSFSNDIGFSIGQCEPKSKEICTSLYNRVDSLKYDTILTQKVNILDGNRHHYSLVIKDKHVSIAIDGKTIRDTDIKLQTNFFMLPGIKLGTTELKNLIIYTLPNSVRHNNDKEWERLRAWQYAFYYITEHEDSRSR